MTAFNGFTKRRCNDSALSAVLRSIFELDRQLCALPLAIGLLLLFLRATIAEDWPVVRGDNAGTGVAGGKLPDELEQLWTYRVGKTASFEAAAVVARGIVYVGDTDGVLHALQLADGKPVWTKTFAESGFSAAPAVDGDRLYIGDVNGVARCLATADGKEVWKAEVGGEVWAGPTPHADKVLFTSEAGAFTCLDKATGEQRWQFRIDAPLRCSPTVNNGRAMLAGCDSLLHGINVDDGKEVFTVTIDGPTGATAAMRQGRVYFGTEGGTFYAIEVAAAAGHDPAVAWLYQDPKRSRSIRAAAAITASLVVYGSQSRAVFALDPESGKEKWTLPMRSNVDSSPVIVGDRVVAATTGGKLYLLDAADGKPRWEIDLGGGFNASPAVADGRLVIGNTDGTLYCFGAKTESDKSSGPDSQATERAK